MEFTPLERDVLKWIAENAGDPAVTAQLAVAEAVMRKWNPVGCFVELRVPQSAPRVTFSVCPVDPSIESPMLEEGGGCVLFFKEGLAVLLEFYTAGDSFPEELSSWKLSNWRKSGPVGKR